MFTFSSRKFICPSVRFAELRNGRGGVVCFRNVLRLESLSHISNVVTLYSA